MSEPIKIVDTSSVDHNEELRGLIPESTYYHSIGITQRVHSRSSPYEASLIGPATGSQGTTYTWQIAANPNASLDLNEAYFEIIGTLKITMEDTPFTTLGAGNSYSIKTEDLLIPSDLWYHSLFSLVQLRIGDANVSSVLNPVVHNVFRKLMFHGEEKNQLTGFAGSHIVRTKDGDKYYGGLYNFANGTGIISDLITFNNAKGGATNKSVNVRFSVKMMVQDLFDTDDIIPIFNQHIKFSLQRSSLNDISIQCANSDFKVELDHINYFQLNTFSYLLEESNKKMLMKIYDTPRALVYGTKQQVFQTITSKEKGGQVSVNSPSGLLFGAKFLMMYLCKSTTNTNVLPNVAGMKDKLLANVAAPTQGTAVLGQRKTLTIDVAQRYPSYGMGPHAALPLAYNQLTIECGGYRVLYDDITPLKLQHTVITTDECSHIPTIYNDVAYGTDASGAQTCYYTRLYHEYCEACVHTGIVPISHEEFINCYPVNIVEISDFSQIATNSFLNINIMNGNFGNSDTNNNPYTCDGNEHTQLNIICYGLRALQMCRGTARLMEVDNTVINHGMDDVLEVQ